MLTCNHAGVLFRSGAETKVPAPVYSVHVCEIEKSMPIQLSPPTETQAPFYSCTSRNNENPNCKIAVHQCLGTSLQP